MKWPKTITGKLSLPKIENPIGWIVIKILSIRQKKPRWNIFDLVLGIKEQESTSRTSTKKTNKSAENEKKGIKFHDDEYPDLNQQQFKRKGQFSIDHWGNSIANLLDKYYSKRSTS